MTLLERLQSHKGDLLRIKTELFWHGGRGWDKSPGRICVLMHDIARPFTHCMVLFLEGTEGINNYWLEPSRARASDDGRGMISVPKEA